jgi:hypothetical protein
VIEWVSNTTATATVTSTVTDLLVTPDRSLPAT